MLEIKNVAGDGKRCSKVEKLPTIVTCGQAYPRVRTKPRASGLIVEWISCRDYYFRREEKDFKDNHLLASGKVRI